jgi:hypothetical protein
MREGWLCPRCGSINAPFIGQCICKSNIVVEPSGMSKTNDISECLKGNHKWECCGTDTGGTTYRCGVCGESKKEIYMKNGETLSLESTKEFCL